MILAKVSEQSTTSLESQLDRYTAGHGRGRLVAEGEDPARISARGALAEAILGLAELGAFLDAREEAFHQHFRRRLRVLLLDGDTPIGSVSLVAKGDSETHEFEYVTVGAARELVAAIERAEKYDGQADCEGRLIQVPQLYLTALALVREEGPVAYYTVTPPYPEFAGPLEPAAFSDFVYTLVEEHRRVLEQGLADEDGQ